MLSCGPAFFSQGAAGGTDPYFSSVVFLSHCDALTGAQVQSAVGSHLDRNGTPAVLSTTQSKFGGTSLYTGAGTNDSATTSVDYDPGTSDFTWEGWFYTSTNSVSQCLMAIGPNGTTTVQRVYLYTDGSILYDYLAVIRVQSAASIFSINTWNFWQLRRIGTATELALNGTQVGSTYTDSNNYSGDTALWVGASNYPASGQAVRGYVDEYRITNGVGRVFNLPTAAFPNS